LDETNRRLSFNLRSIMGRLAGELAKEGKKDKAVEICDLAMEKMPIEQFGYSYFLLSVIDSYYKAGAPDKGDALVSGYIDEIEAELIYYSQFKGKRRKQIADESGAADQYFRMLLGIYQENRGANETFNGYLQRYNTVATNMR
jgi:hypothetical protein